MESRTRRRLSLLAAGTLLAFCCAGVRASVGPAEQRGVFALLDGSPKIVSTFWAEHGSRLSATLKIRQYRLGGTTPILNYDVEMERLMHMVIVRDDFATFAHLHPPFDATTGTFSQPFTKAPNHRYYVYADTTPRGIGQQVFRFTIESDGPVATAPAAPPISSGARSAGPYTVRLDPATLGANSPQLVKVTVLEAGRPAGNLKTYLGAAAHAVFINTSTLAYVHVHPHVLGEHGSMPGMVMEMGEAGPRMEMQLPALPAGTYRLWLQFRGAKDRVYTAPFTMLAR